MLFAPALPLSPTRRHNILYFVLLNNQQHHSKIMSNDMTLALRPIPKSPSSKRSRPRRKSRELQSLIHPSSKKLMDLYSKRAPTASQNIVQPDHSTGNRTYVVEKYHTHRLGAKIWECVLCNHEATVLYHVSVSLLASSSAASTTTDAIFPACGSMECHDHANREAFEFGKIGASEDAGRGPDCQNCGSASRLNLCGKCTFSREWLS